MGLSPWWCAWLLEKTSVGSQSRAKGIASTWPKGGGSADGGAWGTDMVGGSAEVLSTGSWVLLAAGISSETGSALVLLSLEEASAICKQFPAFSPSFTRRA